MRPRTGMAGEFAVESVVVGVRQEGGGTDEYRTWPASPAEMFRSTAPWRASTRCSSWASVIAEPRRRHRAPAMPAASCSRHARSQASRQRRAAARASIRRGYAATAPAMAYLAPTAPVSAGHRSTRVGATACRAKQRPLPQSSTRHRAGLTAGPLAARGTASYVAHGGACPGARLLHSRCDSGSASPARYRFRVDALAEASSAFRASNGPSEQCSGMMSRAATPPASGRGPKQGPK